METERMVDYRDTNHPELNLARTCQRSDAH
jgi:hypothetical protein